MVLIMHHIISDGWSINVMLKELVNIYNALLRNQKPEISNLQIQYLDFAQWQRNWLKDDFIHEQLNYWKEKLKDMAPVIELPLKKNRSSEIGFEGKTEIFFFDKKLTQNLNTLTKKLKSTPFNILLAVFKILLFKYSGQSDITVGTPVASRNRKELEPLIGFFVNTLVLRDIIEADLSFSETHRIVSTTAAEAFQNQDVPFERLVDEIHPERNLIHSPLFQVMFAFQENQLEQANFEGLTLQPYPISNGMSKFELTFSILERYGELRGQLEYRSELFSKEFIQSFIIYYQQILEKVVENPDKKLSELVQISDDEKELTNNYNQKILELPEANLLHKLIENQAETNSDKTAVYYQGIRLTFEELNSQANVLAAMLLEKEIKPEDRVAIVIERSVDLIVAMLASWKAGACYVPIDVNYPQDRIDLMLNDSKAKVIIAHKPTQSIANSYNNCLILDENVYKNKRTEKNPEVIVHPDQLAYIIYTSGSTGRPKGVMISHKAALNLAANLHETVYKNIPEENLRISLNAPVSFDASVQQIVMLAYGHGLYILPHETRVDSKAFINYIIENKLHIVDCVPAQLRFLLDEGLINNDLWRPYAVLPGGEAIDNDSWNKISASTRPRFYNVYGPTECAVDSTIFDVCFYPEKPLIGYPVANARFYILDKNLNRCPIGAPGELYIAGLGLGRGYLDNSDLTAEKFIPDPFSKKADERMYSSGDLVRYIPGSFVEYLGRIDRQVKLRGFRIELGEIESVIKKQANIKDAAVILHKDQHGVSRLAAFIATKEKHLEIGELRTSLSSLLPDYMVPALYTFLESLPLTPSGKINRNALPEPELESQRASKKYIAPRTEKEELLSDSWAEVLHQDKISVDDNFFELGGDSILTIQVVSRAAHRGLKITPRQMFENPTIEQLALVASEQTVIHAEQDTISGTYPLTPVQQWFFDQNFRNKNHWNQSIMLSTKQHLDPEDLNKILLKLVKQHDVLRSSFNSQNGSYKAFISEEITDNLFEHVIISAENEKQADIKISEHTDKIQASLDLAKGIVIRMAYFENKALNINKLLIAIHHLVIDAVSWRILMEDIQLLFGQSRNNKELRLPAKSTSFKYWSEKLITYAKTQNFEEETDFWNSMIQNLKHFNQNIFSIKENNERTAYLLSDDFDKNKNFERLKEISEYYRCQINEFLLSAFVITFKNTFNSSVVPILLEGHGREDIFDDCDLSRTVGWFTTLFPFVIKFEYQSNIQEMLLKVKELYRSIPSNGFNFGIIAYNKNKKEFREINIPVTFNYLGQFNPAEGSNDFKADERLKGTERSLQANRSRIFDASFSIVDSKLKATYIWPEELSVQAKFFAEKFKSMLDQLLSVDTSKPLDYSASDFKDADLSETDIDDILSELE